MRRHLGQYLYKCDQCPFQAVKKYQLDSHKRRHTGEKPFRCSQCAYACAWNVQLKSHTPLHEQGTVEQRAARTCEKCGVLFSSTSTFNRHGCFRKQQGDDVMPKQTKKRLLIAQQPPSDCQEEVLNNNDPEVSSSSHNNTVSLRKRAFRVPLVTPVDTSDTSSEFFLPDVQKPNC